MKILEQATKLNWKEFHEAYPGVHFAYYVIANEAQGVMVKLPLVAKA